MPTAWSQSSPSRVSRADNLEIPPDPPFNVGRFAPLPEGEFLGPTVAVA